MHKRTFSRAVGVLLLFASFAFVPGQFAEGPWSEHYEPVESPVLNALHPTQSTNPAVRPFTTDYDVLGTAEKFPIVCTTASASVRDFASWPRPR